MRAGGIWWGTWETSPPPAVATHWRSCTNTPSSGLATHDAAPSVDRDTVALPNHRSVMYSAPVTGSTAMFEPPPPRTLARRLAGGGVPDEPPSVDLNTGLGEPGRFESNPDGPLT